MTPDGARSRLVLFLLLFAAAPAAAQYRRTGSLNWSFDDMTVNSGAGRTHASQWSQAYSLDLDGPLLNPNFGGMHDSFSYSRGASITQAANTSIPKQEQTTLMLSADLFTARVRRWIRFAPNFSRTYLHQEGSANGLPYANTVANTAWGFSTGLSLPKFPAVSYSRQVNEMRNPSDLTPLKVRSTTENKSVSYYLGHVVINASEQNDRVDDRLGVNPAQENDYKQASLEANFYEPKWARKLQSLYFRSDASQIETNRNLSQKNGSASFGLFTQKFRTGQWESTFNYGANGSRDFLRPVNALSHNASINSTRPLRAGSLGNSLTASHTPTSPAESFGDGLSLNNTFWRGGLTSSLGASGGWSRAPQATTLSDGLSARLDLFPSRPRSFFADARTSGAKAIAGTGGSRVTRLGLGANNRTARMTTTARLDRIYSHYYVGDSKSISDQFTLETSGRPTPKVTAAAGYNLGVAHSAGNSNSVNHNLHGSVDYMPAQGVDLSASATWTGSGYITSAAGSYSLGKTSLRISYDYRELSTPASYSHVSVTLSRAL